MGVKTNQTETINRFISSTMSLTDTREELPTAPNIFRWVTPTSVAPSVTVQLNIEQLTFVMEQLLRTVAMEIAANSSDDDDWSLTGEQMLFMFQHHNMIEAASTDEDIEEVQKLAESSEYRIVFGEMGIDEAWDRYLTTLEEGRG